MALLFLPLAVRADLKDGGSGGGLLPAVQSSSVEGVVSAVNGSVVTLLGGNVSIDVANAKIVGSGGRDVPGGGSEGVDTVEPLDPASGGGMVEINVGARVSAVVNAPTTTNTTSAPPLVATFVVVTPARDGSISGPVQAVDVAGKSFTLLNHVVTVTDKTKWGGAGEHGAVKGLADLTVGTFAMVTVVVNGTSLPAVQVIAVPSRHDMGVVTFEGKVESIATTSWTISGRTVGIDSKTQIVGNPAVGDMVHVVARADAAGALTALTIVKQGNPTSNTVEFDGKVQSMPPSPFFGMWKIDGRDVIVDAKTEIKGSPAVGDRVHVKATVLPSLGGFAPGGPLQAISIEKK